MIALRFGTSGRRAHEVGGQHIVTRYAVIANVPVPQESELVLEDGNSVPLEDIYDQGMGPVGKFLAIGFFMAVGVVLFASCIHSQAYLLALMSAAAVGA